MVDLAMMASYLHFSREGCGKNLHLQIDCGIFFHEITNMIIFMLKWESFENVFLLLFPGSMCVWVLIEQIDIVIVYNQTVCQ